MKKMKYIFQDWIAVELSKKGFNYVIRPDYKDKNKTVYVFVWTQELEDALSSLFAS